MRFHQDDRGVRYCDIFPEIAKGDINVTIVYPGTIAAWHRHQKQDDYQIVVKGALKIGVCDKPLKDGGTVKWYYSSERSAKDGSLHITAGLWHGSYNFTNEPAVLIYHITNKWDGADEERMSIEDMGFDWARDMK